MIVASYHLPSNLRASNYVSERDTRNEQNLSYSMEPAQGKIEPTENSAPQLHNREEWCHTATSL